jgi:hypothetical protein
MRGVQGVLMAFGLITQPTARATGFFPISPMIRKKIRSLLLLIWRLQKLVVVQKWVMQSHQQRPE